MNPLLVPTYDRDSVVTDLKDAWHNFVMVAESIDDSKFTAMTSCPSWNVHDVIAHIIGIEKMLLGEATPEADIDGFEHIRNSIGAINERWIVHLRSLDAVDIVTALSETLLRREHAIEKMDEQDFEKVGWSPIGDVSYSRFMSIRVFDIWIHEQDIREAVGQNGGLDTKAAHRAYLEATTNMGYVVAKKAALDNGAVVGFHIIDAPSFSVAVADGRGVLADPQQDESCSLEMSMSTYMRLIAGRGEPKFNDDVAFAGDLDQASRVLSNLAFTI